MSEQLRALVNAGNLAGILKLMFSNESHIPHLLSGFHHENFLFDFKSNVPGSGRGNEAAWADIARHTLAFHNHQGGLLIFGINDKSFAFTGATNFCDSARFNNGIRRYVGDLFHIIFSREFIQNNQSYLGIALIPARGPRIARFAADAPPGCQVTFSRGDISVREGDSSHVYRGPAMQICIFHVFHRHRLDGVSMSMRIAIDCWLLRIKISSTGPNYVTERPSGKGGISS